VYLVYMLESLLENIIGIFQVNFMSQHELFLCYSRSINDRAEKLLERANFGIDIFRFCKTRETLKRTKINFFGTWKSSKYCKLNAKFETSEDSGKAKFSRLWRAVRDRLHFCFGCAV
jgi:hypothetical protein